MTDWDAIVIEICQEHGIPIEMPDLLHEKRLQALIRESKMPTIPRKFSPPPVCGSNKRVQPRTKRMKNA